MPATSTSTATALRLPRVQEAPLTCSTGCVGAITVDEGPTCDTTVWVEPWAIVVVVLLLIVIAGVVSLVALVVPGATTDVLSSPELESGTVCDSVARVVTLLETFCSTTVDVSIGDDVDSATGCVISGKELVAKLWTNVWVMMVPEKVPVSSVDVVENQDETT